ncbi:MAG: hypothetical protein LBO73_04805, partial [Holosporaceae bacterium]|nr:hypothetical protein [Holosporaceae bacterium]
MFKSGVLGAFYGVCRVAMLCFAADVSCLTEENKKEIQNCDSHATADIQIGGLEYDLAQGVGYYYRRGDEEDNRVKIKASLQDVLSCIPDCGYNRDLPKTKNEFDDFIAYCIDGDEANMQAKIDGVSAYLDIKISFACIEDHDALDPLLNELSIFLNWLMSSIPDGEYVLNGMSFKENLAHSALNLWYSCICL